MLIGDGCPCDNCEDIEDDLKPACWCELLDEWLEEDDEEGSDDE